MGVFRKSNYLIHWWQNSKFYHFIWRVHIGRKFYPDIFTGRQIKMELKVTGKHNNFQYCLNIKILKRNIFNQIQITIKNILHFKKLYLIV